jgi:peptidoglycan/LPS O-acetylase OafA/YrhL
VTVRDTSKYLKQLDGLRALSVVAVAWSHWSVYWFHDSKIPWAEWGVETFFVISGFLITGILLDNRAPTSKWFILKRFYARRFLRIFPVFYATLAIALVFRAEGMVESWRWHVCYLSNVYFYLHGWCGQLSHFWSLAVEEQFYLFWPLLMIFLPGRFILPAIFGSIATAPLFEIGMNQFFPRHSGGVSAHVLMPCCMDALGTGALLAWVIRQNFRGRRLKWLKPGSLVVGLASCALCSWCDFSDTWKPLSRLGEDCLLGWLVFSAATGFGGPVGWLLELPPVNYLGKISYGLYLFHNFAVSICGALLYDIGNPPWLLDYYAKPGFRIFVFAALTIGLASYSWHRFEKPINDLKRKFPYPKKSFERNG